MGLFVVLICGFTAFILVARRHELHLILFRELIQSNLLASCLKEDIFLKYPKTIIFMFLSPPGRKLQFGKSSSDWLTWDSSELYLCSQGPMFGNSILF